jgi:hypothetical protein
MTHVSRRRFPRLAAALLAVAAAGLLAIPATASAGVTPTPSPTPTFTVPPGHHRLAQQEFDLIAATPLPNGWVLGTGPISITGGFDKPVNSRLDIFEDTAGTDGVRISHEPLGGASIDRVTCSINLAQTDLPWSIHQGFGRFAGATGNGFYDLVGQFSYPTRFNVCTLPRFLTPALAAFLLNRGGRGLPTPLSFDISVQAVGRAAVACPRIWPWSPTSTSTAAYLGGNPDGCPQPQPVPTVS